MALSLNGNTSILLSNFPELQIVGDLTIEFWIKPYNFDVRQNPIDKAFGGEYTMTLETNGRINFFWGTSGINDVPYAGRNTNFTLSLNAWNHCALVRNLSDLSPYVAWYINGIETAFYGAIYPSATASANNVTIGDGYVFPLNASLYEFRIWDVARSQFEISANFNKQISAEPGLALYYRLDEQSGSVATDYSNNGFNGNVTLPTWDQDFPFTVPVPVPTFTEIYLPKVLFYLQYPMEQWHNDTVAQALNRISSFGQEQLVVDLVTELDSIYSTKNNYLSSDVGKQVDGLTGNAYHKNMVMAELNKSFKVYQQQLATLLSLPLMRSQNRIVYG